MAKRTGGKSPKRDFKTIGINMGKEMADELIGRAESMQLSVSKYCKVILQEWLKSDRKLSLQER